MVTCMQQIPTVSSNSSERSLHHRNKINSEHPTLSVGSADTLRRAMTVKKFSEMLDCIQDMKHYASTIEKDLPDYLATLHIDRKNATILEETNDFIQQQRNDSRYILLHDLIKQEKVPFDDSILSEQKSKLHSTKTAHQPSELEKQVESMKRVIAAQPSALDAIYLEALLDFDHRSLQMSSPMDILTPNERKRLDELLHKLE